MIFAQRAVFSSLTLISSGNTSLPLVPLPPACPTNLSKASSTSSICSLTFHRGWLGCGRRRKGIRIWGGVCFHRGWSGEGAPALFATVVLKDRTTLGLTVWRRVFVHEAQTKGVREEDIVAVYGRFGWCTEPPADGQRVWLSEVQDCPVAETFLAPPARVEE